ncbi:hypothetical protein [Allosediminivita pacifica]|uniref:Uncharacterized protein n=1 Tax=Allosediminivita pacifica TaxID=1267769 RepID=A0A2T5ZYU9_9RHOB|nr:hypothetical protein [Allosediminivita pacifica]PTX36749.1 hypothetical protein C8N44_1559 [Allosediminivita pacifica]GGB30528.1 hypothetical protein GCM10011324_45060 [Allosediminivita pacifica]
MSEIYRDDRDVRREAGDDVKRSAERLGEDARGAAEQVSARAQKEAMEQAERAKGGAASEMSGIASALRTAAQEMRSGSPQERTFGQVAESLAGASDALRDRDLGELAGDVSAFARRNPLGFLGGAALAGFAATRFAQATSEPRSESAGATHDDAAAPAPTDAPARPTPTAPTPATAAAADPAVVPAQPKTPGDS